MRGLLTIEWFQAWSDKFYGLCEKKFGYVSGDVWHLYHGDLKERNYFHRTREFSQHVSRITDRDENGLYCTNDESIIVYLQDYFQKREVGSHSTDNLTAQADEKATSSPGMGYYYSP